MQSQEERRVGRRCELSRPCRFQTQSGSSYEGRLRNLSNDGAFVEAHVCPEPGTRVLLWFENIDEQELCVTARVIHRSRLRGRPDEAEGFGVYFTSSDHESLRALAALLDAHN